MCPNKGVTGPDEPPTSDSPSVSVSDSDGFGKGGDFRLGGLGLSGVSNLGSAVKAGTACLHKLASAQGRYIKTQSIQVNFLDILWC